MVLSRFTERPGETSSRRGAFRPVWERTVAVSSALIPGTTYYQKAQGKQMIYMRKDQAIVQPVRRVSGASGR
jgi:hypothetical protein